MITIACTSCIQHLSPVPQDLHSTTELHRLQYSTFFCIFDNRYTVVPGRSGISAKRRKWARNIFIWRANPSQPMGPPPLSSSSGLCTLRHSTARAHIDMIRLNIASRVEFVSNYCSLHVPVSF